MAGSPPRGYWVDFEGNRLGFDCPAGPGGHRPVPTDANATPEPRVPWWRWLLARVSGAR